MKINIPGKIFRFCIGQQKGIHSRDNYLSGGRCVWVRSKRLTDYESVTNNNNKMLSTNKNNIITHHQVFSRINIQLDGARCWSV